MNSFRRLLTTVHAASSVKVHKTFSTNNNAPGTFIDIAGQKTHYFKEGRGNHNLLFIPGILGSSYCDFSALIERMNLDKFTIIAWDPPGCGYSRPPDRTFPFDFHHRDARAAADFLKATNISKTSVVTWSAGGSAGLILAAQNPNLVEKQILCGARAFYDKEDIDHWKAQRDVTTWKGRSRDSRMALYGKEHFQDLWDSCIAASTAICLQKEGDICRSELAFVECPTLIVTGSKDVVVKPHHSKYLKNNIKNSRLLEYEGGKHSLILQFPERISQDIEEFVTKS